MTKAYVIGAGGFTAELLMSLGAGLRFDASHAALLPRQNHIFKSPERALRAVARLIAKNASLGKCGGQLTCRPIW